MVTIKIIKPEEWETYKSLVLESVQKEPLAFGKSFEELSKHKKRHWKKELGDPNREVLGIYDNEKLVGMGTTKYAKSEKFKHIARFSGVYVKSEHRRKGLASLLYDERLKRVKDKGTKKVKLIVNTTQKPAIALYQKYGFEIVANLKDEFFINGKYYDAFLMERII